MNADAQRIAIAEACGWKWKPEENFGGLCWHDPDGYFVSRPLFPKLRCKRDCCCALPNYLRDLNAMHEAEKTLTPEQWPTYVHHLSDVAGFSYDDTMTKEEANHDWNCRLVHATAAQRAEAFLRTLNRWNNS